MKFTKIHSLGNDFLIINEDETPGIPEKEALARMICQRHTGVGADGLLLISIKDKSKGLVNFRIFNADGTEPDISGNGLRCAAAFLHHDKKIETDRLFFSTTAGEHECKIIEEKDNHFSVSIEMGIPLFNSDSIPFDDGRSLEKVVDYPLSINKKIFPITAMSLGNPHCAIIFDRFPARIEWHQLGYEIEFHPFFPKRTNIEFIRILNRKEIEVLFWERGVGETLSSGSGACAAAIATILKDLTDRKVNVKTSTGIVTVEWEGNSIYQTGPAQVVFEGDFLYIWKS